MEWGPGSHRAEPPTPRLPRAEWAPGGARTPWTREHPPPSFGRPASLLLPPGPVVHLRANPQSPRGGEASFERGERDPEASFSIN